MTSAINPLERNERLRVPPFATEHDNPAWTLWHSHHNQQTQQRHESVNEANRAPLEENVEEVSDENAERHRYAV